MKYSSSFRKIYYAKNVMITLRKKTFMKLKHLFCLLPIFICHAANAYPDSVTIRLSTQSKSALLTSVPVLPVYLNPIELYGDSAKIKATIIQKSERELLLKFKIDQPRTIMLMDMFGHELYVRPGDFVDIELDTLVDMTKPIVDDIPNVWSLKMKFKGPGKHYHAFFDSLAYIAGVLHNSSISISKYNYDLLLYFNACKKQYGQRLNYLVKYVKRYKLTNEFLRLAANEIKSTYILALLRPFKAMDLAYSNIARLPAEYKEVLAGYNLQEMPDFFTTVNVSTAYMEWIQYYRTFIVLDNTTSNSDLNALLVMSSEHLKNYPEINYAVSTNFMHNWLRRNLLPAQFTYNYFKSNGIIGKPWSPEIDSLYQQLLAAGTDSSNLKSLLVQSIKQDTISLLEITGNQPVLIDVWASWCLPCIQQDEYLGKIMKKYIGKVYSVKLSMDKDPEAWMKASKKYLIPPENGFLLPGNFESVFAKRFNISAIPRYILLDKDGKVLNDNMPYPSKEEAFEDELKKAISL
jgi:thiol-disulfide isomerase/thioredoxin